MTELKKRVANDFCKGRFTTVDKISGRLKCCFIGWIDNTDFESLAEKQRFIETAAKVAQNMKLHHSPFIPSPTSLAFYNDHKSNDTRKLALWWNNTLEEFEKQRPGNKIVPKVSTRKTRKPKKNKAKK